MGAQKNDGMCSELSALADAFLTLRDCVLPDVGMQIYIYATSETLLSLTWGNLHCSDNRCLVRVVQELWVQ
eukprot:9603467-Heterocapsa_arctica.AAC.1